MFKPWNAHVCMCGRYCKCIQCMMACLSLLIEYNIYTCNIRRKILFLGLKIVTEFRDRTSSNYTDLT